MTNLVTIPNIGPISTESGFIPLERCSDGSFAVGRDGVVSITATGDKKVEFVAFEDHTLAYVKSAMGYPAYYPVLPVSIEKPVKAVLMDLDGTSVLGDPSFELGEEDMPFVSGHSVSEHLQYCVRKYCPGKKVEEARKFYFEHTHRELKAIMDGGGRTDAFIPSPGLKEFLLELKGMGVKIGLVTSGLFEKAWPEIISAFRTLDMGDPKEFYDAIVSAGFPMRKGEVGTLGELSPKPHPWLYAETCRVGLGIDVSDRHSVVGISDAVDGIVVAEQRVVGPLRQLVSLNGDVLLLSADRLEVEVVLRGPRVLAVEEDEQSLAVLAQFDAVPQVLPGQPVLGVRQTEVSARDIDRGHDEMPARDKRREVAVERPIAIGLTTQQQRFPVEQTPGVGRSFCFAGVLRPLGPGKSRL